MSDNSRPEWLKSDNSYDLLYPLSYKEGETPKSIERLQLRRMTAADRLLTEEPGKYTNRLISVLEQMTGEPRPLLLKLDVVDLDRIDACLGFFMGDGPATGATS